MSFPFERQPRKASGQSFNFLKKIRPEKNREIFSILQSHNRLSTKHLHKSQLFAVDNSLAAALRPAVFWSFSLQQLVSFSFDPSPIRHNHGVFRIRVTSGPNCP